MKPSPQYLASAGTPPRISIAMATYNGENFIREQLDSLARQTLLPTEIVITDDGSTDSTLEIIDHFCRTAPFPVHTFRNPSRLGYANNFFKAASLCTGDIIAFCDQDDIWLESKLAVCSPFFADPSIALVAHSAWVMLSSGERPHRRPDYSRTRILQPASSDPFEFPFGFAMLIRKDLLQVAHLPDRPPKISGHDQWLWVLATSIARVATLAEPLVLYRQHQGNVFGAGLHQGAAQQARNILRTLDYDALADAEMESSRAILRAAEQSAQFAESLRAVARKIARRSEFHHLRTAIYRPDSTLFRRMASFGQILLRGGYLPSRSGTGLGPRAAVKDLFFGAPGIFKYLHSRTKPSHNP